MSRTGEKPDVTYSAQPVAALGRAAGGVRGGLCGAASSWCLHVSYAASGACIFIFPPCATCCPAARASAATHAWVNC